MKIQETQKTIRLIAIMIALVIAVAIIMWGVVKVFARDSWLELVGTLLAPSGVVFILFRYMIWRLTRRLKKAEDVIKENLPAKDVTPDGPKP